MQEWQGDDDVPGKGGNRTARKKRKQSAEHIVIVVVYDFDLIASVDDESG